MMQYRPQKKYSLIDLKKMDNEFVVKFFVWNVRDLYDPRVPQESKPSQEDMASALHEIMRRLDIQHQIELDQELGLDVDKSTKLDGPGA